MKKIGIIGGGFSGTMTAVHLMRNANVPVEIIIINDKETFNKGVAFNPYSKKQLLNVMTAKMSAFSDQPDDFLDWVMNHDEFKDKDRTIVASSFLPRYLYGNYLAEIWRREILPPDSEQNSILDPSGFFRMTQALPVKIQVIDSYVTHLTQEGNSFSIQLENGKKINTDVCVIASGNHLPGNPKIKNVAFFESKNYFQDPWDIRSVSGTQPGKPILIVGNGLTMVDTVLGLLENGFKNEIYSISPNGLNILPHRHGGMKYTRLVEELPEKPNLREVVNLFNKHVKLVREFGLSAEPVIDSFRPFTQKIWQGLTLAEKRFFMARLRHLWGVARHRIPLHIHDKIQQLRIDKRLHIYSGTLSDIKEVGHDVQVEFFNKKRKRLEEIHVSRVINCTGPETDLMKLEHSFLKECLVNGMISQDELKLGINADTETFEVVNKDGNRNPGLFTLGSNLKGMLWETTAVAEIRGQAERIAVNILKGISKK